MNDTFYLLQRSGAVLLLLLFCLSCSQVGEQRFSLSFTGLHTLENGFHYEAWAEVADQLHSLGKFNIQQEKPVNLAGEPIEQWVLGQRDPVAQVMVSIEAALDQDDRPSPSVLLAGQMVEGVAQLGTEHLADFSGVSGSYMLKTPSNIADPLTVSGIWFVIEQAGQDSAGLNLPALAEGWNYTGWIEFAELSVSTGLFADPTGPDSSFLFGFDPELAPPFPGEDFLANAPEGLEFPADLRGKRVTISVEPSVDDAIALPFSIKPLSSAIPEDAEPGVSYTFERNLQSLPTGQLRLID